MADLGSRPVLLSASFPSGSRGIAFQPYDADAVADAVTALVAAVLAANGRIVFGGHPTITPLVLRMAADHGVQQTVEVYQSDEFRDLITEPTRELERLGFGTIVSTPRGSNLSLSLTRMRHAMIDHNPDLVCALFVGGMEGIADEYAVVGELRPAVARLPMGAPGGAAARLDPVGGGGRQLPRELVDWLNSPRYPLVAARIVRFLSET